MRLGQTSKLTKQQGRQKMQFFNDRLIPQMQICTTLNKSQALMRPVSHPFVRLCIFADDDCKCAQQRACFLKGPDQNGNIFEIQCKIFHRPVSRNIIHLIPPEGLSKNNKQ